MLESLKKLIGLGPKVEYDQLVKQGAVLLDVRSRGEYAGGNIKGSINIAVDELKNNFHRLPDKKKPIITYCASGMRSASAKHILQSHGYTRVYNGGGLAGLRSKLK